MFNAGRLGLLLHLYEECRTARYATLVAARPSLMIDCSHSSVTRKERRRRLANAQWLPATEAKRFADGFL